MRLLLATAGAALVFFRLAPNWDAGCYVLAARALAEGRVPYESITDYGMLVNFWLGRAALAFAGLTGLFPADALAAILFAITAGCACFTTVLLERITGERRWIAPLVFLVFFGYPGFDAGQRDVLFGVALMPMAAVAVGRARGIGWPPATVAAAALLAAAGASFKPNFILGLALLSLVDAWARPDRFSRVWFLDWLPAGAVLALYLAAIQLLAPGYFTTVLPAAGRLFSAYAQPAADLIRFFLPTAALGALAVLTWRWPGEPRAFTAWALTAALLSASYFLQGQGFSYHRRPAGFFLLLTLGLLALGRRPARWLIVPAVVGTCLFDLFTADVLGITRSRALADPLTRYLQSLPPRTPLLALETGVPPISPLTLYTDHRWTATYLALSELRSAVEQPEAARRLRASVMASLSPVEPDAILVNTSGPPELRWFETYRGPFSILGFFQQDPAFRQVFSRYERVGSLRSLGRFPYDIYVRKGANLPPPPGR